MGIITREDKGIALTYAEGDSNLIYLDKKYTTSATNPTATDDETKDFFIDSIWENTDTDFKYKCTDATTDAAVWVKMIRGATLGETDTTSYRGDRGKIAYNHSQVKHFTGGDGLTADRPTEPLNGSYYYDTDLGYPIWYRASTNEWTDSTGVVV